MLRSSTVLLLTLLALPAAAQELPEPPADAFDLSAAIADGTPLSAAAAADAALAAAPSLERARALARAAEAQIARTRAAMLPRLELSAAYQRVDGFEDGSIALGGDPAAIEAARALAASVTDPAARALWLGTIEQQAAGAVTIAIPRDRVRFSARLTWAASDLFFSVLPAIEASEAGARVREHELEATRAATRRSALEAYYGLARARGAHAVTVEAQRQARAQRASVEAAVRAGYLTVADQHAADARVAEVEQALVAAEAGVEVADAALRMLMGREPGAPFGVALGEVRAAAAADPASAVATRAELRALRAAIDAHRAAGRVEEARGYPRLALFAGADLANPNPYQIPPRQEFTPSWELGAMLVWAPNDTLSAVHRGDELGAERAALEARLVELERLVRLEVAQSVARARAAERGIEAAHAAERAAEAAYAARLAEVRAGRATTAELFAAEGQLHRARLAALDAEVARRLALVHADYASGRL
ncbi:MAG: TolC family protein [Sandaracinaceae bacterium]|nr:TolC family protein [Sandaracinaceae bacterium]